MRSENNFWSVVRHVSLLLQPDRALSHPDMLQQEPPEDQEGQSGTGGVREEDTEQ